MAGHTGEILSLWERISCWCCHASPSGMLMVAAAKQQVLPPPKSQRSANLTRWHPLTHSISQQPYQYQNININININITAAIWKVKHEMKTSSAAVWKTIYFWTTFGNEFIGILGQMTKGGDLPMRINWMRDQSTLGPVDWLRGPVDWGNCSVISNSIPDLCYQQFWCIKFCQMKKFWIEHKKMFLLLQIFALWGCKIFSQHNTLV